MEQALEASVRSLSRIPDAPPVVAPLPPGVDRPLWSVMIPVYNCSAYIRATLERVLAQDRGAARMQIEVIDDASSDADVAGLVREVAGDRVSYFRQPKNVGSLRNFETCLQRSRGQLVHILHGDDLVREGFYESMEKLFSEHPRIGAGFCRFAYIDERGRTLFSQDPEMKNRGVLDSWLPRLCERQRIQYVAMVVKREVYEALGGFYGVEYGEDWEMWVRIAAAYPVGYIPEVLAEYRRHDASISGQVFMSGANMTSIRWVMERIQRHLPEGERKTVMARSRHFYAHYAMRIATRLWMKLKNRKGALIQAGEAWHMSRDAGLLFKIIKLYTRITLNI